MTGLLEVSTGAGNPQEVGRVLAWAAAVEGGSNHPLAQAVVQEGRNRGVEVLTVEEGTLSQVRNNLGWQFCHDLMNFQFTAMKIR